MVDPKSWLEKREYTAEKTILARKILEEIRLGTPVLEAIRHNPPVEGGHVAKHILVHAYKDLVDSGEWEQDEELLTKIRMKPVRTLSGVTTVTVLTSPYPCPGKCIFCPSEVCQPKSYLSDEPGARRALQNHFDPYLQITRRLQALRAVGHPTDKIELLILGGTFTAYPRKYQHWFVEQCYQALNQMNLPPEPGVDADVETAKKEPAAAPPPEYQISDEALKQQHEINENSAHRNVGLVLETRPDEITYPELAWLRSLGATKLQMGAQSLDDHILALNKRGHTNKETAMSVNRARSAGYKVVLHWMPNLLGATPESDVADFTKMWSDITGNGGLSPDEIKIYPTQLLEDTELFTIWQRGEYTPYTEQQLVQLLADVKATIPRYCRVNRVIRDIPSTHVVEGNRRTSLRQDALLEMAKRGTTCQCLRCREVKGGNVDIETLRIDDLVYHPIEIQGESSTTEHFLSFVTPEDRVAGYLRLSLPVITDPRRDQELPDLRGAAIIREIHVYGQSLAVGKDQTGAAQHVGLGTRLIAEAIRITRENHLKRLAVISAVGTRVYYRSRGFSDGVLYQWMDV